MVTCRPVIVIAAPKFFGFFVSIKLGRSSYLIDLIVSFVAVNVISCHIVVIKIPTLFFPCEQ